MPEVRRAKGPHLPAVGVGRGEAEVGRDAETEDDAVRLLGEANGSGFVRRLLDEADREIGLVAVAEGDRRVRGDGEAADLDVVPVVVGVEADLVNDGAPTPSPWAARSAAGRPRGPGRVGCATQAGRSR